jgi:hypothetical protein
MGPGKAALERMLNHQPKTVSYACFFPNGCEFGFRIGFGFCYSTMTFKMTFKMN